MEDKIKVPVEKIRRVYRGRPGCGCGCRGKYWNDVRNIRGWSIA